MIIWLYNYHKALKMILNLENFKPEHPIFNFNQLPYNDLPELLLRYIAKYIYTIGSNVGFWHVWRHVFIWPSACLFLFGSLRTNCSQIGISTQKFWYKKRNLKMSSARWQSFYLGPNELTANPTQAPYSAPLNKTDHNPQRPLLLTWFNFKPNMDK